MIKYSSFFSAVLFFTLLLSASEKKQTEAINAKEQINHKVGINLSSVDDWMREWQFVDVFKISRPWLHQQKGKSFGFGKRQKMKNGYPVKIDPDCKIESVIYNKGGAPTGKYTCLYEGEGKMRFFRDANEIKREPGKIIFNVPESKGGIWLEITDVNPEDPIRDIRVIMPGFEDNYKKQIFHPKFLKRWENSDVIRFMDWQRTNNSKLSKWKNRAKPSHPRYTTWRGVPLEHMIEFCNRVEASPWFCIPAKADNEFVANFAKMVKKKLNPELKVYVEYSNEIWNSVFKQAKYCGKKALDEKLSDDPYQARLFYQSKRSLEIFQIFEKTFEGNGQLIRVLSAQFANPWTASQVLEYNDAYKNTDAIAVAPYFGHAFGNPEKIEKTLKKTPKQILDECKTIIDSNRQKMDKYAQLAKSHGLELIAYEGGQHLVGYRGAENNKELTELLIKCNRHPEMEELYLYYFKNWQEAGGGLFCFFSSMDKPSKWGSWGLLENEQQKYDKVPKFKAFQKILNK